MPEINTDVKVLLFGATGHLGKEIAKAAVQQGYDVTAIVRNEEKGKSISAITAKHIVADITKPEALRNVCKGFDIVISALGKSVSPNDKSKTSFQDIDFTANSNILNDAIQNGIKKFVYVSAFHAENYLHLNYFRVHHDFSELLKKAGIDYSIIKPPALFSAFLDLIEMAKKGQLITMGKGDKKTNPISEADLGIICVQAIGEKNTVIEAGGSAQYTRQQINEIVQQQFAAGKKVRTVPVGLIKMMLPLIRFFSRNAYDKFAFFAAVTQQDTIAPAIGKMTLEEYLKAIPLTVPDRRGE